MNYQQNKFKKFLSLLDQHSPQDGPNLTSNKNFATFKASATHGRKPMVERSAIWIVGQGQKFCYVGDKKYDYSPGIVMVLFFPTPLEFEVVKASPESPFLTAGVAIDMGGLADVLLKLDRLDGAPAKPLSSDPSSIFSVSLNDYLLDPFIRLFESLSDPRDAAMLGDAIVDEIYYRLLCDDRGSELRYLLQQRGEIQRISRAVEYIHQNLDQPVSVEGLADMVHMGQTSFYENFKSVMHVTPLQYAKSVKLFEAQKLIREGKKANEAGYLVGYNSPAQFSREYKRHFGFAPSAT